MKLIKKSLAMACILALAVPAAAFAESSNDVYGGRAGNVVSGLQQGSAPQAPSQPKQVKAAQGSSLPFTGADLGVLAAAGGLLVGFGFGLRRLTHRPLQT